MQRYLSIQKAAPSASRERLMLLIQMETSQKPLKIQSFADVVNQKKGPSAMDRTRAFLKKSSFSF